MASNLVVARGGVEYVPPISLAFWRWTLVFVILLPFTYLSLRKNYKIIKNESIDLFNNGDMIRDFTYVGDIVNGVNIVTDLALKSETVKDIYNIGNGRQVPLIEFVENIEFQLQRKAQKNYVPKHPADTQATWSDTTKLQALGYKAETPIEEGVEKFITWYKGYYNVN